MKGFEYKLFPLAQPLTLSTRQYEQQVQQMEDQLNELGREGWELVVQRDGLLFFKRALAQ